MRVTTSQLDITNENQEGSAFPAGDHKASRNKKNNKGRARLSSLATYYSKKCITLDEKTADRPNHIVTCLFTLAR